MYGTITYLCRFQKEVNVIIEKYRVMTVEKIPPPDGMTGNWHHYVIGEGNSKIEGKRPGTLQAVTQHAETVAESLNLRAGKGSYPTYIARKKDSAQKK